MAGTMHAATDSTRSALLRQALALSMGAAISLGITRFAYGLLLPPMRDDLGWSFTLAGSMNTANALGYLLGALCTPALMRRWGASRLLLVGAWLASLFMAGSGFFTEPTPLLLQRLLAGVASAWVFISGGVLAARLAQREPARSGLLLGLYYGGTGLGIVASALAVPPVLAWAQGQAHGWAWAWWALALVCALATLVLHAPARAQASEAVAPTPSGTAPRRFRWQDFGFALAGYGCFGVGYIGYMTFVIALLRQQGASGASITVFYALLGLAVVGSSRVWAGLLDRHRGGGALARLNATLGVAILLPAIAQAWPLMLVSGVVFGGVFLSVVASTTALVRHNLPALLWPAGISAFTTVFAAGQIVGPVLVGGIADGPGGLALGLAVSAGVLWLGAVLAAWQRPL